ncbi:hypothetical protein SEA_EAGLEHORSE_79 [Mycobacterium phage Eaglehorse]|uniref:Uncharacterized protein n=1 Tax=Mycobacterium phage Eaglehorse TaxID=2301611 RepID=A0A385UCD7_9CAUD|nr:hypothetical protein SEA_EAGLEHORSE_79 [Mycobacterium phage Eaglehorse]
MDPDALVAQLVDEAQNVLREDENRLQGDPPADGAELARMVLELDAWFARGGFLPQPWSEVAGARPAYGTDANGEKVQAHTCYFADTSGGFDWPKCVVCGRDALTNEATQLRECCRTRTNQRHASACTSLLARIERRRLRGDID